MNNAKVNPLRMKDSEWKLISEATALIPNVYWSEKKSATTLTFTVAVFNQSPLRLQGVPDAFQWQRAAVTPLRCAVWLLSAQNHIYGIEKTKISSFEKLSKKGGKCLNVLRAISRKKTYLFSFNCATIIVLYNSHALRCHFYAKNLLSVHLIRTKKVFFREKERETGTFFRQIFLSINRSVNLWIIILTNFLFLGKDFYLKRVAVYMNKLMLFFFVLTKICR